MADREGDMRVTLLRNIFGFGIAGIVVVGLLYSAHAAGILDEVNQHPTLTPAVTQMPLPERPETLSDIQALLQERDENCQLPCFWGIRPGYTPEEEVTEFLQPVSVGNNAPELHYAFREEPRAEPIFSLSFGVSDGVVSETSVALDNVSEWLPLQTLDLSNLLIVMPSEPSVYISINLSQRRIFVDLAYSEGVLAQYGFKIRLATGDTIDPLVDNPFLLCPSLDQNDSIILRLRDGEIEALLEDYGYPIFIEHNKTWTLEHMIGMDVEEFVGQITENPNDCIEMPSYPKLLAMGYEF
jgi:hypothetical protein